MMLVGRSAMEWEKWANEERKRGVGRQPGGGRLLPSLLHLSMTGRHWRCRPAIGSLLLLQDPNGVAGLASTLAPWLMGGSTTLWVS